MWLQIALLSVLLAVSGRGTQIEVSADLKELRGTWQLIEEVDDGNQTPAEEAKKGKLTFDGSGRWNIEIDGHIIGEGTATIDPRCKPKTIDYTFTKGENAGIKFLAIYELNGDSFRHCGMWRGARPSEFSSKPGSGETLATFRREKRE